MAKKTLSGGGGGSLGKSVDWRAALLERLRGTKIPQDAVCVKDLVFQCGKTQKQVNNDLASLIDAGEYVRAWGRKAGEKKSRFWYWPSNVQITSRSTDKRA